MTKAEKRKHRTALGKILKNMGFVKDKWGTFRVSVYKVDLRKDKVEILIKHEKGYKKEYSDHLSKMTEGLLEGVLEMLDTEE
jgi:hypothetical protein